MPPKSRVQDESASSSVLDELSWAQSAQDLTTRVGLAQMLIALQLLATDEDRQESVNKSWNEETPASMQVIKSGATAITRTLTKWVGAAGGISGAVAVVAAVLTKAFHKVGDAVVISLIGGAALVLAATAIALALFVSGDLEARGRATAARHSSRAEVAAAFLAATADLPGATGANGHGVAGRTPMTQQLLLAFAAFPGRVRIRTDDNPNQMVLATGIRSDLDRGIQIGVEGGYWETVDRVQAFSTAP